MLPTGRLSNTLNQIKKAFKFDTMDKAHVLDYMKTFVNTLGKR